jgi:hypothetical protein
MAAGSAAPVQRAPCTTSPAGSASPATNGSACHWKGEGQPNISESQATKPQTFKNATASLRSRDDPQVGDEQSASTTCCKSDGLN